MQRCKSNPHKELGKERERDMKENGDKQGDIVEDVVKRGGIRQKVDRAQERVFWGGRGCIFS